MPRNETLEWFAISCHSETAPDYESIAILLALYGLFMRHWTGLLGGTILCTILVYYGLGFFLRCYAVKLWGLGDWTRGRTTAVTFLILAEAMGLIGLAGLWSNWRYFLV